MSAVCIPPTVRPEVRTAPKPRPSEQNTASQNLSENLKFFKFLVILHLIFLPLLVWLLIQLHSIK